MNLYTYTPENNVDQTSTEAVYEKTKIEFNAIFWSTFLQILPFF